MIPWAKAVSVVDRIIWLCPLALLVPATRVTLARDVTRNLPEVGPGITVSARTLAGSASACAEKSSP